MEQSSNEFKQIPLPASLYNSETNEPISHCIMCDQYLLGEGTPYMIEKAVRQIPEMNVKEVIFEYAMCVPCSIKMHNSLSVESRQRISEYFATHVDLSKRSEYLDAENQDLHEWIANCAVKKTPISESSEYQIVAQCQGKNLVMSYMPLALSGKAIEEMSELLSAKSRGELDDFIGKYFTGPPEVSEILKRKLIFV